MTTTTKLNKQAGFSLLEFAIVLSISMIGISAATNYISSKIDSAIAISAASHINEVGLGTALYVKKNQESIISSGSINITVNDLKTAGLINNNIPSANPWGSDYFIALKRVGASRPYRIDAIVSTKSGATKGGEVRIDIAGEASQLIKLNGGSSIDSLSISGNAGSWKVSAADFAGMAIEPAQLAMFFSSSWAGAVDATYVAIDGSTIMSGNLNMAINNVNEYNAIMAKSLKIDKNIGASNFVSLNELQADSIASRGSANANYATSDSAATNTCDFGSNPHHPNCWRKVSSSCFTSSTAVLMADGKLKPIDKIEPGDFVFGKDKTTVNRVVYIEKINNHNGLLYSPSSDIEPFATINHPIFIDGTLYAASNSVVDLYPWLGIRRVLEPAGTRVAAHENVYNLWIDGDGTYIVNGLGTTSIIGNIDLVERAIITKNISGEQFVELIEKLGKTEYGLYGMYLVKNWVGFVDVKVIDNFAFGLIASELKSSESGFLLNLCSAIGKIANIINKIF